MVLQNIQGAHFFSGHIVYRVR